MHSVFSLDDPLPTDMNLIEQDNFSLQKEIKNYSTIIEGIEKVVYGRTIVSISERKTYSAQLKKILQKLSEYEEKIYTLIRDLPSIELAVNSLKGIVRILQDLEASCLKIVLLKTRTDQVRFLVKSTLFHEVVECASKEITHSIQNCTDDEIPKKSLEILEEKRISFRDKTGSWPPSHKALLEDIIEQAHCIIRNLSDDNTDQLSQSSDDALSQQDDSTESILTKSTSTTEDISNLISTYHYIRLHYEYSDFPYAFKQYLYPIPETTKCYEQTKNALRALDIAAALLKDHVSFFKIPLDEEDLNTTLTDATTIIKGNIKTLCLSKGIQEEHWAALPLINYLGGVALFHSKRMQEELSFTKELTLLKKFHTIRNNITSYCDSQDAWSKHLYESIKNFQALKPNISHPLERLHKIEHLTLAKILALMGHKSLKKELSKQNSIMQRKLVSRLTSTLHPTKENGCKLTTPSKELSNWFLARLLLDFYFDTPLQRENRDLFFSVLDLLLRKHPQILKEEARELHNQYIQENPLPPQTEETAKKQRALFNAMRCLIYFPDSEKPRKLYEYGIFFLEPIKSVYRNAPSDLFFPIMEQIDNFFRKYAEENGFFWFGDASLQINLNDLPQKKPDLDAIKAIIAQITLLSVYLQYLIETKKEQTELCIKIKNIFMSLSRKELLGYLHESHDFQDLITTTKNPVYVTEIAELVFQHFNEEHSLGSTAL